MERIYLKLYNFNDIYMSPSGDIMDAVKVGNQFPASQSFPYIVQTDAGEEMMYGFYSLSSMKSKYNISQDLTNIEAVQAIEEAMNAEQEAQELEAQSYIPPEERIAASLEFQTLTSLPDVE